MYFGLHNPWKLFNRRWWGHLLNPLRYWRAAKYFWQRGMWGYADCDLWSLDTYLGEWLPSALERMKDGGFPVNLTAKKWNNILDKMALGFRASYKLSNMENTPEEEPELRKQETAGLKLFAKHFGNLWT